MARVQLRLFAAAREAAGLGSADFEGAVLDDVLEAARTRYGAHFGDVLASARVWVNGDEPATGGTTPLTDGDEVAVLPPVSGG